MGLTLTTSFNRWTSSALGLLATLACVAAQAGFVPAYTVVRAIDTYEVKADGSYYHYSDWAYRVDTPQGIAELGEYKLTYNEKLEDVEIWEA